MTKLWLSSIFALIFALPCRAMSEEFEDFLMNVVPQRDRDEFSVFYNKLINDQQSNKKNKRIKANKEIARLEKVGSDAIEIKNPEMAKKNLKKISDGKKTRTFLVRYGAYDEFCKQKIQQKNHVWARIKNYTADIKNKVKTVFRSSKSKSSRI